jgi:hypothetical protein
MIAKMMMKMKTKTITKIIFHHLTKKRKNQSLKNFLGSQKKHPNIKAC